MYTARISLPVATLWLVITSCATTRPALTGRLNDHVIVNGEEVAVAGDQTLLELLRQKATASRLGEQTSADQQPLVLVDGIAMTDGIGALTGIPAFQVERVSLLRETQAVPLYGSRARKGAIIVTTKQWRRSAKADRI